MSTVANPLGLQILKTHPQWVCYNENKVPYNPVTRQRIEGDLAEGSAHWTVYEIALTAYRNHKDVFKGVGYEFVKSRLITGVDLDHCIDEDGNLSEWATYVVGLLDSYTEYSPSMHGLHIWLYGSIPTNLSASEKEHDGDYVIEIYDCKKYFTVTGKIFPGSRKTIEHREEQITELYQEVRQRRDTAIQVKRAIKRQAPAIKIIHGTSGDTPYGLKALSEDCADLASMGVNSGRNDRLNTIGYKMGQYVGGHELTRVTVEDRLHTAARQCGLPEREIEKTLYRAVEDGIQSPRSAPVKSDYIPYVAVPVVSNGNGNGHAKLPYDDNPPLPVTTGTLDLCAFDADDSGNGDAMYALYHKGILWCASRGWFVYNGTFWELDIDGASVRRRAVETLRQRRHAAVDTQKEDIIKCTRADDKRVNGAINRFKSLVGIDIEKFDSDPDSLNCANGVVNLRTGKVTPHSSAQRFTYCVPVDYKKSACLEWLELLENVVGGGQEVIDYIQLALGYSFTGHTREEIMFYLFGPTRSGKGSFSETIMALLPRPLATAVEFNTFTAKREGDMSNFDLAPLKPSRLIFASESNKSQSLNPAKVKSLTGGDTIMACFKHKDHFTYRPQFKIWLLSNFPVNGDPEDDALWGRVRVIEFPNSFLGIEDKSKKEILKTPKPLEGVLYWIVQGAMKWYTLGSTGLPTPPTIAASTKAHRDELDYIQKWLEECCEANKDEWTSNDAANKSYLAWCESNNVQHPKGGRGLAQSLKAKGYIPGVQKKIGGLNQRGVQGLRISSIY